ncbi:hypothetical protein HX878_19460 [Pseudomonas veronii]|uniref:hypothetical protein n=1 Tax=Pseudomonas veronii TaxID=76761 RepID=UPI0015A1C457|nr:hypothetical protein [Pseudomonas veronii]NWD56911.1 hypothetical protein [Pseudomonas veronii]
MSKINLTTVVWFQAGKDGRPIGPTVTLEGVESRFPSVKFPEKGITFLYGHRNPGEAYLLRKAAEEGYAASIATVHIDIGLWLRDKIGFDANDPGKGIENTGFFALVRAKKEVMDAVVSVWTRNIPEGTESFPKGGTRFANLFDQVIEMDSFKHLKVIAYTISTKEAGDFQVATLFDLSAMKTATYGSLLSDVQVIARKRS